MSRKTLTPEPPGGIESEGEQITEAERAAIRTLAKIIVRTTFTSAVEPELVRRRAKLRKELRDEIEKQIAGRSAGLGEFNKKLLEENNII